MSPDKENHKKKSESLRDRAEGRVTTHGSSIALPEKKADIQRLVHELQVHQIELEIQNEELKRTRDELETFLERYTELYDFAPVGYFTLNRNGVIQEVNLKAVTMLEDIRPQIVGRKFRNYVLVESLSIYDEFLDSLFGKPNTEIEECEVALVGPSPIIVSLKGVVDKSCNQCFIAVTDITARKNAEAMREKLLANIKAKNLELEQFTYVVSHDLKSPMISIRGFLSYAEKSAMEGNIDGFQIYIAKVHASINKLEHFIQTLLELSRIGRVANPPTRIRLSQLIHDSMEMLAPQIQERGIEIVIPDELPELYGDKVRLQQVMTNLLGNAVKFMGDQKEPKIEISAKTGDGFVTVCIRDNGIGISGEYLERIFSNFTRLNPGIPGSGFGLTIVKRIVEFHGGRVWAESGGPGTGSSFYFSVAEKGSQGVII